MYILYLVYIIAKHIQVQWLACNKKYKTERTNVKLQTLYAMKIRNISQ